MQVGGRPPYFVSRDGELHNANVSTADVKLTWPVTQLVKVSWNPIAIQAAAANQMNSVTLQTVTAH